MIPRKFDSDAAEQLSSNGNSSVDHQSLPSARINDAKYQMQFGKFHFFKFNFSVVLWEALKWLVIS